MKAAAIVGLQPLADAKFPNKPEHSQKPESFARFVKIAAVVHGTYVVAPSDGAWVDAIQDGAYIKPKEFSGATGCEGIRKTIKFELSSAPLIIQVSGMTKNAIHLALQPVTN
ncbi:MAG: hypothetical protein K2W78_14000 [Xanthobacteraceae bacterium]|nr:hypothetical protein [Xanthobacteraceae bacterium]